MTAAALVATWFGVGRLPKAPGTWGSIATLPPAALIAWWLSPLWLLAAAAIVFVVGWWASDVYASGTGIEDPGEVVIDEVAGQLVPLAVVPLDPLYYLAGLVLFRLFDIWKPWPVSLAERRLGGGLGIMADDVVAGLYAAIVLLVALEILK